MATSINRAETERLISEGAQVVEALPTQDYEKTHIAGAISLPLKQLDAESAKVLDRDRPVVYYCWDSL
jgi:rhodanese-related sulfurtransferase